jgi:hypothetical protein
MAVQHELEVAPPQSTGYFRALSSKKKVVAIQKV